MLSLNIYSFSYLKTDLAAVETVHGGGYQFDCRCLDNPGRYDQCRDFNGKNKEVIDFIEQHTGVGEFLDNCYRLIDLSVERYVARGFDSLMVGFGCTGGQHRSVYCADSCAARFNSSKWAVDGYIKVDVRHLEQHNWPRTN